MSTNAQSRQIQSLVSYILDTKPYSRKLTDIGEEYRFTDYMTVNFRERLFNSLHKKGTWTYSQLSNGTSIPQPMTKLQRLVRPLFRKHTTNNRSDLSEGAFKAFRDENTDIPLIPFAFDPVGIRGPGLADAFVQRQGIKTRNEPLLEGHDVFLSHGAYVFQINQTLDASSSFVPLYTDRRNHNLISDATQTTRDVALDVTNPASCVNVLKAEITGLQTAIANSTAPAYQYNDIIAEITGLMMILNTPDLPSSYETLVNLMELLLPATLAALGPEYSDIEAFHGRLEAASPSLFFGMWSDLGLREAGLLRYKDQITEQLEVTNISCSVNSAQYQEWTLRADSATTIAVIGSYSGFIGYTTLGSTFSNALVTFTTSAGVDTLTEGYTVKLTPAAGITIHPDAPLETWSLIKVNPMAYSRPRYHGLQYGYVMDTSGNMDSMTVLDPFIQSTDIVLEAITSTTFSIKLINDPMYSGTATVGTLFNDGVLAFTIHQGASYTFVPGDKFFMHLENSLAVPEYLDIYYGFDMGGFDAYESIYTNVNSGDADYLRQLEFGYDSRFVDYDMANFAFTIQESAIDGVEWRLRAIPDVARPLLKIQRDSNTNNLLDETELDGSATSPQYDQPSDFSDEGYWSDVDPDSDADLELYYASEFALEYYDTGTNTWVFVDAVPIGSSYSTPTHGFSFTLAAGSKPFIGAILHSSWYDSTDGSPYLQGDVSGGDVFYWTTKNTPTTVTGTGLTSSRAVRLIMHGDTFQKNVAATWTLTFNSSTTYSLQGITPEGALLYPTAVSVDMSAVGYSYRDDTFGVHFTVVPGQGTLASGDTITFETYSRTPSYLVHGSVSGWQEPAVVGEYYFNGKIGFLIETPLGALYENGVLLEETSQHTWTASAGAVSLNYIRPDSPSNSYTFRANENNRWVMYRNGALVSAGESVLSDTWITITLPLAPMGTTLVLTVGADDRSLSIGRDLAIVKTTVARSPTADDFCLFERTREDSIGLFIKPVNTAHNVALGPLDQVAVDQRFIDLNTNGDPLSGTSPEVDFINGWVPILTTHRDGASIAEFYDQNTDVDLTAAATGQTIGTISKNPSGYYFTWNTSFFDQYMPLNSEAIVTSYGSGMSENVNVNFSETLNVLIGGGGLAESFLFNEDLNIGIDEFLGDQNGAQYTPLWKIKNQYDETFDADISDGPFGGFLPGYDVLPFDAEDGADGYFDPGLPLVSYYERAVELSHLNTPTPEEEAEFDYVYSLIVFYLNNASLENTTLEEFIANMNNDDLINQQITDLYGSVARGLAIDANHRPQITAGASFIEAMSMQVADFGAPFDESGYDSLVYDEQDDQLAFVSVQGVPPIPSTGIPSGLYVDYDTSLEGFGRVIRVGFTQTLTMTPTFYIWLESAPAPVRVNVIDLIDERTYEFSIPQASNFKLVVL